ncbi:MAG: T9SS type A sorting domain-containing protein, partial [Bacteroidales bacterium]|nr:T9SS type A sorting domain-containing protein [Candidatus Scybalocola fimicaballi]
SKDIVDNKLVESFGFPKVSKCADSSKQLSEPWDCWAESDAVSGDYKEVFVAFPKSGENAIQIQFVGDASGVGPLIFDFYKDLPDDLINCCDDVPEGGVLGAVDDVENANVSIIPNPTSGEFTVSLANDAEAVVEVVNMAGQVVASQIVDGTATINKTLTPGVYTVVVKSEGAVGTQKLMVK